MEENSENNSSSAATQTSRTDAVLTTPPRFIATAPTNGRPNEGRIEDCCDWCLKPAAAGIGWYTYSAQRNAGTSEPSSALLGAAGYKLTMFMGRSLGKIYDSMVQEERDKNTNMRPHQS